MVMVMLEVDSRWFFIFYFFLGLVVTQATVHSRESCLAARKVEEIFLGIFKIYYL
jgi:hypothetical protein